MSMLNQSLETIRTYWAKKASPSIPDIDWLGETITGAELVFKINTARAIVKDLGLRKDLKSRNIFGIDIEDSLNNLALGIALILEGLVQAIIPFDTTETQHENLSERYQVTILATSKDMGNNEQWERTTKHFNNIYFYRRSCKDISVAIIESTQAQDNSDLLLGTTSGTTSNRPKIISANSHHLSIKIDGTLWSPYQLINRPLLGPGMQDWSSRFQKILFILNGKSFVTRQKTQPLQEQPLFHNCDGTFLSPNGIRQWIAYGNMQSIGTGFLMITGSDRVPMDLRKEIFKVKHVDLGITYATSQTGPITWLPPDALLEEEDSVGWPLKEVSINLLKTNNSLHKNGKIFDEAMISTPRETINPGDYLHISQSGQVIFGGRSSEVFLFNSILVSPLEIEDVLKTHAGIKECAAFGGESNRFGSVPMAAYTIQPGWAKKQIEIELDTLCREHLGKIRPRKYVALETLPTGNTGKVLRRELSRMYSLKL